MAQALQSRGPVTGTAVTPKKQRKFFVTDFYATAVGKKYVMAVTGVMLLGFVFMHMIGNLKMYLGAEDFNHYAEFLRELLVPIMPRTVVLWLMRGGLVAAGLLHVHAAVSLTKLNREARSVKYQGPRDYQIANFASRTMRATGIIVFLFLFWHLADLTWGWWNATGTSAADGEFVRGEAYGNVVRSFERVPVAVLYIIANIALGTHLYHGVWSVFQTFGINNRSTTKWIHLFSLIFAVGLTLGFAAVPLGIFFGFVS